MSKLSDNWNNHYLNNFVPNIIVLVAELFIGVVGNGTVLFVYASGRMKDGHGNRYFIPFLAALDLTACVFSTSFGLLNSFFWVRFPSGLLCKLMYFFSSVSSFSSAHVLFVISLQRYMSVVHGTNGKQMTLSWRKALIAIILISVLFYTAPFLHFSDTGDVTWVFEGNNVTGSMCFMTQNASRDEALPYYGAISLILTINIIATIILYSRIGIVVHMRYNEKRRSCARKASVTRSTSETTNPSQNANIKRAKKSRTNFNLMFFLIIAIYIMSYIPLGVLLAFDKIVKDFWFTLPELKLGVCAFMNRLFIINFIVNPFIYGYFDTKFRKEIYKLFCV